MPNPTNKLTHSEVLRRFSIQHGDHYDYNLFTTYYGAEERIEIICPSHGVFEQRARSHWAGYGCWDCSRERPARLFDLDKVLDRFHERHSDTYNYDLVEYVECTKPVQIVCKVHGVFSQSPAAHWRGQGCPSCRKFSFVSEPETLWADMIQQVSGWAIDRNIYLGAKGSIDIVAHKTEVGDIAIEFDGHYWHSLEDSVRKDTAKTCHLVGLGYTVVRLRELPRGSQPKLLAIKGAINFEVTTTPLEEDVVKIINQLKGIGT